MSTYGVLFVATEDELALMFPGWSLPRAEPDLRTVFDLRLGKPVVAPWWVPDGFSSDHPASPLPRDLRRPAVPPVVPPEPDEAFLEERAPKALKSLPHACLRQFDSSDLVALVRHLVPDDELRPARVAPDNPAIVKLSSHAILGLSAYKSSADLAELAEQWAHLSSEHGTSLDPITTHRILQILRALVTVASQSVGRDVCLFCES